MDESPEDIRRSHLTELERRRASVAAQLAEIDGAILKVQTGHKGFRPGGSQAGIVWLCDYCGQYGEEDTPARNPRAFRCERTAKQSGWRPADLPVLTKA